jgi:hypothetical protein
MRCQARGGAADMVRGRAPDLSASPFRPGFGLFPGFDLGPAMFRIRLFCPFTAICPQ